MDTQHLKAKREPLIRITKRIDMPTGKAWILRVASVLAALIIGALLMAVLGYNPFEVYADILRGSLASETARKATAKITVPLLVTAVALAPAFRMKFWNIGAEGQITAGAIVCTYFALFQYQNMPKWLLVLMMFLTAAAAGAVWGLIPGFLKAWWGINETLLTLMLNYIAIGIVKYFRLGPWKEIGSNFPKIPNIDRAARLPEVFGVHMGWIIAVLLVIAMFVYMRWTKHGYEIAVVGESENTARYSGMNVRRIIIRTMLLSGAIAGMVGCMLVAGSSYILSDNIAGGYGFTAIIVAWLAKLNPFVMVLISLFIAVLEKGSNTIQTDFGIPASAAEVLTGLILICMLASEFFVSYKLVIGKNKREPIKEGEEA
jgi:simple sugar transport system permease protein